MDKTVQDTRTKIARASPFGAAFWGEVGDGYRVCFQANPDPRHAFPMHFPPPIPVTTLTTENLRQFAVWRYLHDDEGGEGPDESFVTPADEVPPVGSHGSFVVAATYLLHGGDAFPGAVQLDQLGAKRLFTPILIHVAGKCLDPLATDIAARLSRLQKTPNGAPVRWTLDVTLPGDQAPASGRIFRSRVLRALALLAQLVSIFFTPRRR